MFETLRARTDGTMWPRSEMSEGRNAMAGEAPAPPRALDARSLMAAAVVAIGYIAGVQLGLALTFKSEPISTLWPPNAVLLTGLLLTPPRRWWLLVLAVLPAHLIAETVLGVPLTMAACWFISNVAEALLGAAIMVRWLGTAPQFDRTRDVAIFIFVAVALIPALTSFLDVGFVALVGWRYSDFWSLWRNRTLSNALAALIVVPLLLSWIRYFQLRGLRNLFRVSNLAPSLESVALVAGLCVTCALVFDRVHPPLESMALITAPMPFLLWAAIRRGVGGVSLCLAIVAMFSIVGALNDLGPFGAQPAESAARALQAFLLVGASSLMLLAASLAELQQARALAQRNTERLNLALRAARMGTWEWDIVLNQITYRSRSSNALIGRIRSHTQSFAELLDQVRVEDHHLLLRVAQRAAEGSSCEVEFRLRRRGGKVRWISSRGKVILDSTGRARRMIGVYTDTTLRKSQDAQVQSQREQIARLNKASLLGELSAALAHELRQPLTAILSNAEAAHSMLTTTDRRSVEVREILSDIIGQNERASQMIDRLRALFVRGEPKSSAVDTNECIRQVLAMEASYLSAHSVASSMGLDSATPAALIDPVELQQVLINLIVNACDAMGHNAPADRFFEIRSAAHDGGVMIEIDNSGPSIADCEQVFEPFFTTKPDGLGLGLAICRTVIGAYQGRLWATSEAPRGATFHIWLPKAESA